MHNSFHQASAKPEVRSPQQQNAVAEPHPSITTEEDKHWLGRVVLGAFSLESVIGEGGFAAAFLARQLGTDRSAVVKIARPEMLEGHQGGVLRERFATELRASTRVKHPNLVTVYTAGEIAGSIPAIAMEYVEGVTLETFLQHNAPVTPRAAEQIFDQLFSALAALHNAGIVHCDVTPSNIIVQAHGDRLHITLLDFGIATLDDVESPEFEPMGTPRYTATEQIYGHPTFASDIFSLGCLMWWAFTGSEYLEVETLRQGLAAQRELPYWPQNQDGDLPVELAELLRSLVHPDQDVRPGAHDVHREWRTLMHSWETYNQRLAAGEFDTPKWTGHNSEQMLPQQSLSKVNSYRRSQRSDWRRSVISPSSTNQVVGLYRPHILLVDNDLERQQQLLSVLEVEPCRVQAISEPRLASIHMTRRDYDAVLISIGKIGLQGYDTALSIRNSWDVVLGDPVIFLVAHWEDADEQWKDVGADIFLRIPDDLVHLPDYISQLRRRHTPVFDALDSQVVQEFALSEPTLFWHTAETFVGIVPELLLTLEESLETGEHDTALAVCQELISRCHELGADHMESLVTTIARLQAPEYLVQRIGMIQEIEEEYSKIVQDVLLYRQTQFEDNRSLRAW